MKVVAVIPAYNEEEAVGDVVEAVRRQGLPVIVVDDCSSDGTSRCADVAGAIVTRHIENFGKGKAVLSGVQEARKRGFSHVLILDADGQHDAVEIPAFIRAARNADIVVGSRMHDPAGMPFIRKLTNRSMSIIVGWCAGKKLSDTQSGFRLISMKVWDAVPVFSQRFDMESELLITACRSGFSVAEVPIKSIYGTEVSKINPWVDTGRFFGLLARMLWTRPWRMARKRMKTQKMGRRDE